MSKATIQPGSNLAQNHNAKQAMAQQARPIGQHLAAHAAWARPARAWSPAPGTASARGVARGPAACRR
jgi:hypothetical protein